MINSGVASGEYFKRRATENEEIGTEVQRALGAVTTSLSNAQSMVVLALAHRAIESAKAIHYLLLYKEQFVDDAACLLRVLIEHVIDAGFIAVNDPSLAEKYVAFGDIEAANHDKYRQQDFPEMQGASTPAEYQRAKSKAIARFPELKKARSWHQNLHERAAAANVSYGERCFTYLHTTKYGPLSARIHGNSLSSAQRIQKDGDLVRIDRRYGPDEAANVMFSTSYTLLVLGLVLDTRFHGSQNVEKWRHQIIAMQVGSAPA